MLVFDPSAASKQHMLEAWEIGTSPVYLKVHTLADFDNAFKNLTKKEMDLKRPLGIRIIRFGEYWVEGTTAWHKVIAFKQAFCRLDTRREETHRWIVCGCIATAKCYHCAKAFEVHTVLAQQEASHPQ